MSHRVGIDIGGTFTDLVFLTEGGEAHRIWSPTLDDDRSKCEAF